MATSRPPPGGGAIEAEVPGRTIEAEALPRPLERVSPTPAKYCRKSAPGARDQDRVSKDRLILNTSTVRKLVIVRLDCHQDSTSK